jgi:O-antigen/teichoic acid export membrane protein
MSEPGGLPRLLRNAGALLAAYVVPRALTFAAALLAARLLRPAAFGAYGMAAALAITLSVLCSLGLLPLLVREIAREPARGPALVAAANRIKLAASVLVLAATAGLAALLGLPGEAVMAASWLAAGQVCWAIAESTGARLQAEERMAPWVAANVVLGASGALLGAAAVWLTHSVAWFAAGLAAGQLAGLLYLRARVHSTGPRPSADAVRSEVRFAVRATAPFALAFLALTIFYKFDVLLLGRLSDAHSVGIYAAGYKLVDVAHALAVIGAAAVYPRLARTGAGGSGRDASGRPLSGAESPARRASADSSGSAAGAEASRRTLELALLGAVAPAAALWLLREPITAFLFGADYAATGSVLALLAPATALLAVNIVAGYLLAVADRTGSMAAAYLLALAVKLACALAWARAYGAVGTAAAMLVGELAAAASLARALHGAAIPLPRARTITLAAAAASWAIGCSLLPGSLPGTLLFGLGVMVLYPLGGALSGPELISVRSLFRWTNPRAREAT